MAWKPSSYRDMFDEEERTSSNSEKSDNGKQEQSWKPSSYRNIFDDRIQSSATSIASVSLYNSFLDEAGSFFAKTSDDLQNNGFDAAEFFEERKKQADLLKNRAKTVSKYLDDHVDSLTPESYDIATKYLEGFDSEVDNVLSLYQPSIDSKSGMRAYEDELLASMKQNQRMLSMVGNDGESAYRSKDYSGYAVNDNWTAEQRYRLGLMQMDDPKVARDYAKSVNAGQDPYLAEQQRLQEKEKRLSMDLNAEKREIDRMKAELDDYYWNTDYDATATNARNAFDQEIRRREQEISDREQQYNLAKREQESAQFRSAVDQSDFAAKSGYAGTGFELPAYVEDADQDEMVYEYINNPDIRSQINQQTTELAAKGYDLLDEEEVGIYNYYYATEGPVKAQQYLDNIQETLNDRIGKRSADEKKDKTWRQYFAGFNANVSEGLTNPRKFFDQDSDYINTSPSQYMSQYIREDLADTGPAIQGMAGGASLGQIGYDLVSTIGNMAPSIAASMAISAVMPGVGAGISALGGKAAAPWLSSLGTGISAAAPKIGAAAGAAMMGLSSAGGAYQQALNAGYSKEQSKAYAALTGAAEAGMEFLLGGISKLGGEIPQQILSEMVRGMDNAIAKAALTIGGDMVSEGFEEGLQEIITPWMENLLLYADKDVNWDDVAYSTLLGALSGGVMEGPSVAVNTSRVSRVDKQLQNLGAKGDTWDLAELIVKHRSGEQLSQEEFIKLVKSEPAMKILEGMRSAEPTEPATANMTAEQVEEMKPTTSKDGNARQISRNASINVVEFADIKDGKTTVKTDSGTVDYSDVSFGTEKQGNQYFAVESLPAIDTAHANDLLRTIQNADVGNDTAEVIAIRESYRLGYMGASTRDLRGSDANILPTKLQDQIYDIGRQQRSANDAVRATVKAVPTKATGKYKKVVIEGNLSKMDGKRKAEIDYMDRVADTFAGTAVHVYESYEKNGKMYYRDNSGKEQLVPNGKYVNDEIWVDLNSGDKGEGLVLNTFAHEMYHHIEKWNKPKARELAEFVVKELGLESVDKAVQKQIEKARAAGLGEDSFKGMTPEQARNEVYMRAMSDFVADSLETMFTRGDPAKAIANLKKENRGLFDQIKAFIDEWISKVKQFYSDKTISKEGAMVAQLEKFEQLQQLFMEAMAGAGENYRKAAVSDSNQKDTAKFQARSSFKNGVYTNIDSRRYWYPAMTKSEIADVKSLADHEANTTNNYLGIDSKWLYNNQKGHKYFALYSTADAQGTTLLYACKGENAEYEYNILKGVLEMEDGLYGSTDSGSETISQILDRTERTTNRQSSDSGRVRRTGSNNGNASVHSKNTRTRSSAAFRNCLENISKVQSRYGVDDHYLFAVERGDLKTAQQMVDEAAQKAGYTKLFYHGSKKGGGFTKFRNWSYFTENKRYAERYAQRDNPGSLYTVYGKMKKPFDTRDGKTKAIFEDIRNEYGLSELQDTGLPDWTDGYDITDYIDENDLDYDGVILDEGGDMVDGKPVSRGLSYVIRKSNQVKSADVITYDDEGNIIPISQRFNEENEDIRYSLRNQQPTTREILMKTDPQTQKTNVRGHLTRYQERVVQLGEAEARREEVRSQIDTLAADPKKNRKELAQLRTENRNLTTQINGLKEKLKFSENTDMMRKIVANERLKNQPPAKSYKDEQEDFIRSMLAEHRVIRKELTGADSVMFVMEDTFVKLAKDYEAKKIDMKTMEKEFMRIMKEYEKQTEKSGKKAKADSEKIDTLTEENKIWLREYKRLMKEYDLSDRKIARLEATIARQRATAKARVEGRRKTEMRHKIQRKVNELDQLLRHGTKHRNVPEFLQDSVAAVLQAINMEVRDSDQRRKTYEATIARYDRQIELATDPLVKEALIEKRDNYAAKGDQFANRMAMLQKAYEQIRKENTGLELDEGIAEHLNSLFETVGNTPLGQMTAAQLDAVNDILNVTMATVRNANEMLAEARSAGVVESSKSAIMEIKSAGETKKKKTRLRKNLEQFGWNNLKPVYAFDVIGSKTLTDRYEALRKGEDTLAVDLNEAKEFFQEQWKKNGGKEWDMEQKWKFTSTSGKSFELDLNQIMSLYALAKDKDARSHLRVGGFAFDSDYQTKEDINLGPVKIPVKVESTDASAYNLSDEILGEIISKLTPQQRAFADAMQAYLSDTMAAKGNEVSLKKYGIRLFKKKDYFPIRVADPFMAKAREQQAGDRKLKDAGFTKDRKPEAKNPVVLSGFMKTWAEHVDEMSLYHSFVLPLDDFNRVLNYHDAFVEGEQAASVVEAITNAFGKGAVNYIDQLIKDVNGGIKVGSTVSFANSMMSKAKKAQTMASLSVAIQQPSSIIRAMSEVDTKYFYGPRVTEKSHDRTWNEIKEHAPIAIIKEMGGYDTNVGKSTVDYLTDTADYDGFGEKFKAMFTDEKFRDDALGRLPALMDEMAWGVIWNAVKREQRDRHPNMDTKSDAFMKLVANRFTEVITRTQVYDSVFSRNGLMRDRKSDLAKMTTSFMAEPTTTANMLAVSILQAKRGDIQKKQAAKTTASIVASLALNAALVSVIYALRDDDEDKRYDEKYVENFRNNFFESLNPVGYIPYFRDIYNVFVKGYDVERADMELYGDFENALRGLHNDDLTAWEKTENVIGAIGNLLGVPVKNILRDVKGVVQTVGFAWDDRPNPKTKTGTYMAWRGMDLNDKEQMILAIQSGDEEHLQRVFGRFENQQKAESALQSAIGEHYKEGKLTREEAEKLLTENFDRDDENEVYWILDKWDYAKEYGSSEGYLKYGKFFEGVESGDFEAEMERLLDNGSDASEIRSQITRKYRKEYLADETAREAIREKLLPVYEATGMYADDIEQKFHDWDFEAEYGMTFSSMKAEYRDGNITEKELRSAMDFYGLLNYEIEEEIRSLNDDIRFVNKYDMTLSEMKDAYDHGDITRNQLTNALVFTGMTQKEAKQWVTERDIENRLGIDYAKLDDAYKHGDISRQTLYNSMIEHGATRQEADEAIIGYDWLKKNVKKYPDLTISDAKKFAVRISSDNKEYTLTDFGVKIDDYIEYSKLRPECKGVDNDGDGKADDGTKRDAIFQMIDSLPISSEAKDGLAMIDYGMKSIRKNAPWH